MRMLLCATLLLAAGCLDATGPEIHDADPGSPGSGDPGSPGVDPPTLGPAAPNETSPWPKLTKFNGDHPAVVGVCLPETRSVLAGTFQIMQELVIPEGTNHTIAQARWDGPVTAICLDMQAQDGEGPVLECWEPCLLSSETAWRLDAPSAGTYMVQFGVQGPAAQVAFEWAFSSFASEPPEDYSAW